ncbi:hypothetical protein [Bradyrhizobium centrolobii]|uniref:hypothetical protein n=1 Tax=Bradyrhizobium centrolobii TaxID=1505087 RepID=UPI0010A954DE|nr:hypothetical protein [Bradyrhizobium centrolobii]
MDAGHDFPEDFARRISFRIFLGLSMFFIVVGESPRKFYSCDDAGATSSSQIAAALLIDLGTLDIRRVGTNRGEYSKWGVPSKKTGPSVA